MPVFSYINVDLPDLEPIRRITYLELYPPSATFLRPISPTFIIS